MSGLARSAGVLLLVVAFTAQAQNAQDQLVKARSLVGKGQFGPALKLVEKAQVEPGNDLDTTLELLELTGICNAALKKAAPAQLAFVKLLSLSPGWTLKVKKPALIEKAWNEAKKTAEPLSILPTTPDMSQGHITEVAVEVKADPQKLAKTVLFNYRVNGGKWKTRATPAALGRVAAKVDPGDKVEWYATVLGANDAEVMHVRDADSPIAHTYSPPAHAVDKPPERVADASKSAEPKKTDAVKPSDAPKKETVATLTPSSSSSGDTEVEVVGPGGSRPGWVAPASWGLIGAGVVAGGIGTFLGVQSGSARKEYANAASSGGVVVGLTRARALELDSTQRTDATLANALWVTAGVMAAAGLAILLFGPHEAAQ